MIYSKDKILLSIAIPTYNRAGYLVKLLENIAHQAKEFLGSVEICVSNNGSSDNTSKIMAGFKNKHPEIISYNENPENLGLDKNMIKVMKMSRGKFVWLMGDDDWVVDGGVKKVFDFLSCQDDEKLGLAILGHRSYAVNKKTGSEIMYYDGVKKDKPKIYEIEPVNVIGIDLNNVFMSVLIFNNKFLKKIFDEEKAMIEKTIGQNYIHLVLYNLLFFKFPLKAVKLNEEVITSRERSYKSYIEDYFLLYYAERIFLSDVLTSFGGISEKYKKKITKEKNRLAKEFVREMMVAKVFKVFNCLSFFGCINLFFKRSSFFKSIIFSLVFIFLLFIPSIVLRSLYKFLIILKYREGWKDNWLKSSAIYSGMSEGDRRMRPTV